MYKKCVQLVIPNLPKGEPIDLYLMKRGANLIAAAVTSNSYQAVPIDTDSGIREVEDFTKLCEEHEFELIKNPAKPRQYDLAFTLDMRDTLCSVNDYPCKAAVLPDQLLDCLAG